MATVGSFGANLYHCVDAEIDETPFVDNIPDDHFDSFSDTDCIAIKIITASPVRSVSLSLFSSSKYVLTMWCAIGSQSSILPCSEREKGGAGSCHTYSIADIFRKCKDHKVPLLRDVLGLWRLGIAQGAIVDSIDAYDGWEEVMELEGIKDLETVEARAPMGVRLEKQLEAEKKQKKSANDRSADARLREEADKQFHIDYEKIEGHLKQGSNLQQLTARELLILITGRGGKVRAPCLPPASFPWSKVDDRLPPCSF